MPVEKVFWSEPYRCELPATVTGADGPMVTLDRTIFYAFSGGQEADTGTIAGRAVLHARWTGAEIFYTLDDPSPPLPGDPVTVRIDWPRRHRLMRLHFAAEIVLELVYQLFNRPEKTGAHISEEKARIDFLWDGRISDAFPALQEHVERIIGADLSIISAFSDRVTEQRYWEIPRFARVPCGGIHPRTTGEVGSIELRRNNVGKGTERIEIRLA